MQEKVEFFNSQSSFGSEQSLANSRYLDLNNQISNEVQILFMALRRQFLPTKQLTNYDKIQYLINRANIIATDTIPQHLNYLQKISIQQQIKKQCVNNQQQLIKLIKNFQSLRNDNITHKNFYNIYCRSNEQAIFMKKTANRALQLEPNQKNNHFLQPDIVEVNLLSSRQIQNQPQPKVMNHMKKSNFREKELKNLQEQISRMKKIQEDLKKQFDLSINRQKMNHEQRIKHIFQTIDSKSFNSENHTQLLKKQLNLKQNQLQSFIIKNNQLISKHQNINKKYSILQQQNESLKEELAKYRKLQISNFEQHDWDNQSVHSQLNSSNMRDSKKLSLNIKRLEAERDLLKNQLLKERQINYSEKLKDTECQSRELIRTKKFNEQTTKQYQETLKLYDKARVQAIQLKQENVNLKKDLSTVKQSNQQFKKKQENSIGLNIDHKIDKPEYRRRGSELDNSKVRNIKFGQYQGEGIEGIPYFQLLSKQFRIRFKRACLKEKELLYKAYSLQVGVITEFFAPNYIKILVHLTNYGDKDIKNLKIKLMNPNQNKTDCDTDQVGILNSNQQIKTTVSCLLKNYPIGPVVLLLDYQIDVSYDLRLLLPVHIFKCVTFSNRGQKMLKPTKLTVKTQKKICKDEQSLKEYFNCARDQPIKIKVRHQHSNSSLFLDAYYQNEQITLLYEHIQGYNNFTEYFIKTLKTVFMKQH